MNIAVYCGSDFGNQDVYKRAATELGKWIGKNNHTLVYGGGESGLMGAVAKEVHEAGRPCRCADVLLCGCSKRTGSKD